MIGGFIRGAKPQKNPPCLEEKDSVILAFLFMIKTAICRYIDYVNGLKHVLKT